MREAAQPTWRAMHPPFCVARPARYQASQSGACPQLTQLLPLAEPNFRTPCKRGRAAPCRVAACGAAPVAWCEDAHTLKPAPPNHGGGHPESVVLGRGGARGPSDPSALAPAAAPALEGERRARPPPPAPTKCGPPRRPCGARLRTHWAWSPWKHSCLLAGPTFPAGALASADMPVLSQGSHNSPTARLRAGLRSRTFQEALAPRGNAPPAPARLAACALSGEGRRPPAASQPVPSACLAPMPCQRAGCTTLAFLPGNRSPRTPLRPRPRHALQGARRFAAQMPRSATSGEARGHAAPLCDFRCVPSTCAAFDRRVDKERDAGCLVSLTLDAMPHMRWCAALQRACSCCMRRARMGRLPAWRARVAHAWSHAEHARACN